MSADDRSNRVGTKWQIERIELVFYNARHRRWQYFVEDPHSNTDIAADGESLHRRQIRNLLRTIHGILEGLLGQSGGSISIRRPEAALSDTVHIEQPANVQREYWALYLDYLSATAWSEGLSQMDMDQLGEFTLSYQPGYEPKTEVQRNVALNILSLLPILDSWDTWGCLLRTHKSRETAGFPGFPPKDLEDLRHICYLFDLDYTPSQDCDVDLRASENILGDRIAIQGAVCGWKGSVLTFAEAKNRADFFAPGYCTPPRKDTDPTRDEEPLYRCYGQLIDPILKHLYGRTLSRQFVIAFPVLAGGKTHFLQLAFSSLLGRPSLNDLWNSWRSFHNSIWTSEMRFFLREQLLRIQVLAFQTEMRKVLTDKFMATNSFADRDFKDAFYEAQCSALYHLFPVVSMKSGKKSYGYYPYYYYKYPGGLEIPVGFQWRKAKNDSDQAVSPSTLYMAPEERLWKLAPRDQLTIQVIAPYVFSANHDDNVEAEDSAKSVRQRPAELIATHEARELLDEQEDFFTIFEKFLPEEERRRKEDDQRCARIVHLWASKLSQSQKTVILNTLYSCGWETYLGRLLLQPIGDFGLAQPSELRDWHFRYSTSSLDRYLTQGFHCPHPVNHPNSINTSSNKRSLLYSLLRPSLLLRLSEYFETGPVIPLTHTKASSELDKVIEGGLDGAKRAVSEYEQLHRQICDGVAALKKDNRGEWLKTNDKGDSIHTFHSFFDKQYFGRRSPENLKNIEAVNLRTSLRVDKLFIAGRPYKMPNGCYFYGIDPSVLLSRFSERYIEEFTREKKWNGCTIQQCSQYLYTLTENFYYRESYHTDRQDNIALAHHFIILPYKIDDYANAQRISTLLEIWNSAGKEIGELFHWDRENVYQFAPSDGNAERGQFVFTDSLSTLIEKIACKKCPKLILRFDHWTQEKTL